jgi:DNA-binding NarL/FixJ family response regulator
MVPVPNAPVRVLIASRSPALSAGLAAFLPDPSLDVELAGSVEEALAGLAAADHDLVIIDRGLARALVAGAAAGLAPALPGEGPLEALADALRGDGGDDAGSLSPLVESARRRDAADALLTEQERVVLRLMRRHLTYKEIAQSLGVSWHTVRTHAQSILRKRGVHSRRDLQRDETWEADAAAARQPVGG